MINSRVSALQMLNVSVCGGSQRRDWGFGAAEALEWELQCGFMAL